MSDVSGHITIDGETFPSYELQAVDLLYIGLRCFGNLIGTFGQGVHGVANEIAAHANHTRHRRRFADSVSQGIEALTRGDES